MRRLVVFLLLVTVVSVGWSITSSGPDSDPQVAGPGPTAAGVDDGAADPDGAAGLDEAPSADAGEVDGAGAAPDVDDPEAGDDESGPTSVLAEVAQRIQAERTPIRVTMAFTGDILSHGGVIRQAQAYGASTELAYDYRPMFALVQDRLQAADLAICVLETPLSVDNTDLSGYPIFSSPYQLADALAAVGYDGCSIASNHALDRGGTGVRATLDNLDRAGVRHAGTARTAEEAATPTLYEVNGMTIGHLSWTYGTNGIPLPPDMPWAVNVTDPDAVLAEARTAKEMGADFVVLHLQWGNEYQHEPTPEQRSLAELFLGSPDIDVIVANHVHVVQPIEKVGDKWVVYGLGNFLSNQSGECCPVQTQDGVIVHLTVEGTRADGFAVVDVAITPTWVDRSDYTIVPVGEARHDPNWPEWMRGVFDESWNRTVGYIGAAHLGVRALE